MNAHERIEREVEETIACFEQVDKIESDPYFYVRVMGKILSQEQQERYPVSWLPGMSLLRPVFPIAIVIVNLVTVALVLKSGASDTENRGTRLTAVAEQYSLSQDAYSLFPIKK